MSDRHNIQSELERLAPNLARLKTQGVNPPEVPDAYFESLPDDVLIRVKAEEGLVGRAPAKQNNAKRKPRSWSGWFSWRPALALAGVLLVLAGAAYWFYPSATPTSSAGLATLEQLEDEEINQYITQNISEFDMALLMEAELLNQDALDGILIEGLPEDVLDEYLDEILDDIDLEDLEEVL